jgi:tetratricopeptide (TPR) repeat protein
MDERVFFLPSIGIAITVGALLDQLLRQAHARTPRSIGVISAVVMLCALAFAVRSATRVPTWSTQARFYTGLTADAPRSYLAWKTAGVYWYGAGEHDRAIADLQRAAALWPHDYEVNDRLGQFLRSDGQCDAAIPVLIEGVQLDPDAPTVRAKLIECLVDERRWDDAERYARDAIAAGHGEFASELARVRRLRATADSARKPDTR